MKLSRLTYLSALFSILGSGCPRAQVQTHTINSPDGRIAATFFVKDNLLRYRVDYGGEKVIGESALGIEVDGTRYDGAESIVPSRMDVVQDSFLWRGVHRKAHHYSRAGNIKIRSGRRGSEWGIDVEVFDEGVAFRYIMPHSGVSRITHEFNTFAVPESSEIWWQGDIRNYEGKYSRSKPGEITENQTVGLPITVVLPKGWDLRVFARPI